MEEIKNKMQQFLKKNLKRLRRIIMFPIVLVIIFLLLIPGFIYFLTVDDGTYKEGDWSSPGFGAAVYKASTTVSDDGSISAGRTGKEIWDEMVKNNSRIEEYLNGPEELVKLVNAEMITQLPDTRPNPDDAIDWDKVDINSGKIQGIVKFKRADTNGKVSTLSYIDEATFYGWVEEYNNTGSESAKNNALSHFILKETSSSALAGTISPDDITTELSNAIIEATKSTPSPGAGWCLAWVNNVYQAAGINPDRTPTAYEAFQKHCISTDMKNIPVGAAVYGTGSKAAGRAGHVGIYIGNGEVIDNIGSIRKTTLEAWVKEAENANNVIDGKVGWLGWGWEGFEIPQQYKKNGDSNKGNNKQQKKEDGKIETKAKSYCIEVATWSQEKSTLKSDDPDVETGEPLINYTMGTTKINYPELIEKYTMPFNLLWALLVVGEEKDFVLDLADLVYNSQIEITVHDNYTKNIDVDKWTYKREFKNSVKAKIKEKNYNIEDSTEFDDITSEKYTTTRTVITETDTLSVDLTKANVWVVDYEIKYKHQKPTKSTSNDTKTKDDEQFSSEPRIYDSNYEHSLIDGLENRVIAQAKKKAEEEKNNNFNPEIVKEISVKTYPRNIDIVDNITNTVENTQYTSEPATIKEKTDKKAKEANFVTIFNKSKYKQNKSNIKSASDWLWEILETNEDTADMVDLMKYLLYKATGKNYGITEFDFNVFYPSQLTSVGSDDYIVHTEKSSKDIVIKDLETLKRAFGGYSGGNKLIENAATFLKLQEKYKVNAVFAAAVSISETGAGRAGNAVNGKNNWFNIECTCGGAHGRFETYGSVKESIEAFFVLISKKSYYFTEGNYTVRTIGNIYCENAEQTWIPNTLAFMTQMLNAAGIDTNAYAGSGPQFYQDDYANVPYGDSNLAKAGCGPTSFAMVASQISGKTITPKDAIAWCGNAYYVTKKGTAWSYFQAATEHFQLNVNARETGSIDEAVAALKRGKLVISSQDKGIFTTKGHFILLYKVDNSGKIFVKDPNKANAVGKGYNTRAFTTSEINAASKQYFIFE